MEVDGVAYVQYAMLPFGNLDPDPADRTASGRRSLRFSPNACNFNAPLIVRILFSYYSILITGLERHTVSQDPSLVLQTRCLFNFGIFIPSGLLASAICVDVLSCDVVAMAWCVDVIVSYVSVFLIRRWRRHIWLCSLALSNRQWQNSCPSRVSPAPLISLPSLLMLCRLIQDRSWSQPRLASFSPY
jgi:hypothetical protein